jgi:hypothetical protein
VRQSWSPGEEVAARLSKVRSLESRWLSYHARGNKLDRDSYSRRRIVFTTTATEEEVIGRLGFRSGYSSVCSSDSKRDR